MQVAALDRRRCRSVVLVEYTRIAAVTVNRDVLLVLLEDHACMGGVTAAREGRQTAAGKSRGQSRTILLVLPCCTVLQPQIECAIAEDKTIEVRCSSRQRSIHTAARINCGDIAVKHDFAAAGCAVLDIDIDSSVVPRIERHSILGSGVCLGSETVQCHRTAISLHRLADFRAIDIDFRHAGDIRHGVARGTDAPGGLQRRNRSHIVHEELQRLRLDVKRLSIIGNSSAILDARPLAAALDRQHTICGIDVNIRIRLDCAAVHFDT